MKFNLVVEDEEDQSYVDRGLSEFLSIDKAGQGISDKIKSNARRLLRTIALKHDLDYTILRVGKDTFTKGTRDAIGLVDEVFEDGGGHWVAFYYIKDEDHFILYDSTGFERDTSFVNYLLTFSNRVNSKSKHPMAVRARTIRKGNVIRQPIPSTDTSYASQHQFCFAEGLLFLEELLGNREISRCKNEREALLTVKRYMGELGMRLKYDIPEEFFYIWDDLACHAVNASAS